MGYFPVRYDSRVVNYDHRGFIRLATGPLLSGGNLFTLPGCTDWPSVKRPAVVVDREDLERSGFNRLRIDDLPVHRAIPFPGRARIRETKFRIIFHNDSDDQLKIRVTWLSVIRLDNFLKVSCIKCFNNLSRIYIGCVLGRFKNIYTSKTNEFSFWAWFGKIGQFLFQHLGSHWLLCRRSPLNLGWT